MNAADLTPDMTLQAIADAFPETIPVFVDLGFPQMADPSRRAAMGARITLARAAEAKGRDAADLLANLRDAVREARRSADLTLAAADESRMFPDTGDVRVAGLLPCPVRIPLLETFDAAARAVEEKHGVSVGYRLAAASVGMDVVEKEMARLKTEADLPDIFLSAGFEAFFDHRNLRRFKDAGVFADRSWSETNAAFAGLDIKDPDGHFSMIGAVPAIFLVDTQQLDAGEPVPRTWSDLLDPRLERRVALPVGDFDLFNGILLTLWKHYGDDGVRALARNLMRSLHPSQAAGRFKANRGEVPAVSVIPYFFSRMAKLNPKVEIVWPADGAVLSPIFMLERADAGAAARELADVFLSREAGEILAHKGLFPSLHPEVVNELPDPAPWLWLGWDFVREHDLGVMIPRMLEIFHGATEAQA